jgi:hypothetical protein
MMETAFELSDTEPRLKRPIANQTGGSPCVDKAPLFMLDTNALGPERHRLRGHSPLRAARIFWGADLRAGPGELAAKAIAQEEASASRSCSMIMSTPSLKLT